jgi:hypothetical protein
MRDIIEIQAIDETLEWWTADKWNYGYYGQSADGVHVNPLSAAAVSWCLYGALCKTYQSVSEDEDSFDSWGAHIQEAHLGHQFRRRSSAAPFERLQKALRQAGSDGNPWIYSCPTAISNSLGHSVAVDLLKAARAILVDEMAST